MDSGASALDVSPPTHPGKQPVNSLNSSPWFAQGGMHRACGSSSASACDVPESWPILVEMTGVLVQVLLKSCKKFLGKALGSFALLGVPLTFLNFSPFFPHFPQYNLL